MYLSFLTFSIKSRCVFVHNSFHNSGFRHLKECSHKRFQKWAILWKGDRYVSHRSEKYLRYKWDTVSKWLHNFLTNVSYTSSGSSIIVITHGYSGNLVCDDVTEYVKYFSLIISWIPAWNPIAHPDWVKLRVLNLCLLTNLKSKALKWTVYWEVCGSILPKRGRPKIYFVWDTRLVSDI